MNHSRHPSINQLTITWAVSAEAIRRSPLAASRGIDRDAFAAFSSADAAISLAVELESGSSDAAATGKVTATLTPPRSASATFAQSLTDSAFGRWEFDERERLIHLTINEPTSDTPLLVSTLRIEADSSVSVLYARTTLLAHLGIPGGRYEVAGASMSEAVAANVHSR